MSIPFTNVSVPEIRKQMCLPSNRKRVGERSVCKEN